MPLQHTKIFKKLSGAFFGKDNERCDGESANHGVTQSAETGSCSDGSIQAQSPGLQQIQQSQQPASTAEQQGRCKPQTAVAAAKPAPGSSSGSGAGKQSFFFARVPPMVTHGQLLELFSQFGEVQHLNLFRPFAEAKTSKGCGICQFTTAAAAAIAKSALHGKYKWAEDASPMVVEWVNEDKMRSTCHKAGSNEIVFEPKSSTRAKKQQRDHSANHSQQQPQPPPPLQQQQQQLLQQGGAACGASMQLDAAAAAGLLGDTGNLASEQLFIQWQQAQLQRPPPPPPPPPPVAGVASSSQQPQQWPGSGAASSTAAARQALLNRQQQQQLQQQQQKGVEWGLSDGALPNMSAAAAAAAQLQQEQDIVQAMLACCAGGSALSGKEAYVPTFTPLPGSSSDAVGPGGGLMQQQQQQQLLQMQLTSDSAAGLGNQMGSLDSSQQLLLLQSNNSLNSGLVGAAAGDALPVHGIGLPSGFSLLDTSSLPGLQPGQHSDYHVTSNASNLSAAHTFSTANVPTGLDNIDHYSTLGSSSMLPQHTSMISGCTQQYAAGGLAAAGTELVSGGNAAAAAARAAAWQHASIVTSHSAAGVGLGHCPSAADNMRRRQILSAGCNVLPGGSAGFTGSLSGTCLPAVRQQHQQQQLLLMPYDEDPWMAGCGSGYFDMPNSSSQHAAAAAGSLSGGGTVLEAGPRGLRAASDSGMLRALPGLTVGRPGPSCSLGATAQQVQQLQLQILQQQQQAASSVASRPASSAVPGSALSSSPLPPAGCPGAAVASCDLVGLVTAAAARAPASGIAEDLNLLLNISTGSANDWNNGHQAPVAAAAAAGGEVVNVPVAKGSAMVGLLSLHLDSITKLSGAEVQIRGDSGELVVWVRGTKEQVSMAHSIVGVLRTGQQHQQT